MSCNADREVVLTIGNVSKCFEMYEKPIHRLLQMLFMGRKKFYREFWALRDINIQIRKGECIGIIGRNGAGKSTLLQIVTGTLASTTGNVDIRGRVAALLELGSGFNPEFTGRENVYMSATILGLSKNETDAKYQEIIDFADIGEFIEQPVKTYSSGMMVRLAFAVNVIVEPEILIVDEALAVGDVAFQAKCFKRIQRLQKKNTTILFVTHDLVSIVQYCNRAFILDKGSIYASGDPLEMVDKYKLMMAENVTAIHTTPVSFRQHATVKPNSLPISPHCQEYGDMKAKIEAYRILNKRGDVTTELLGNQEYELQMDIRAYALIENPIAAFIIRDANGIELCGTNTLYLNVGVPPWQPGTKHRVFFRFVPSLQTKSYLLRLGCTEYVDGGLAVHHRLYDVCDLNITNSHLFSGVFDLHTTAAYQPHI